MCFFSSRRRHTRFDCDWSSDVCSSDLNPDRHDRDHDLNRCEARTLELPTREQRDEVFRDSEDHEAEETEQREIGRPGRTSEERGESIVANRESVGPHEGGQDPEDQEQEARDNREARGEIAQPRARTSPWTMNVALVRGVQASMYR